MDPPAAAAAIVRTCCLLASIERGTVQEASTAVDAVVADVVRRVKYCMRQGSAVAPAALSGMEIHDQQLTPLYGSRCGLEEVPSSQFEASAAKPRRPFIVTFEPIACRLRCKSTRRILSGTTSDSRPLAPVSATRIDCSDVVSAGCRVVTHSSDVWESKTLEKVILSEWSGRHVS